MPAQILQINPEDQVAFYPGSLEYFFLFDKLVAAQVAYTHAGWKENYYEIKYFYDPRDGEVWAKRVTPDATSPRHRYISARRKDYSSLLTPWEWNNLSAVVGPNIQAMLFLHMTEEKESAKDN